MEAFLSKHRIAKGDKTKATHTGYGSKSDTGRYAIAPEDLHEFYSLIVASTKMHGIVECIPDNSGSSYKKLMIDFDFRQDASETRTISTDDIENILNFLLSLLNEMFAIKSCRIIVQQRSSGYTDTVEGVPVYKDGLHIIIPDIMLRIEDQFLFRTKYIKDHCEELFGKRFRNSYDDIFDSAVIGTNAWHLQGCGKAKIGKYETVSDYIYALNEEESGFEAVRQAQMDPIDFIKLCSYADSTGCTRYEILPEFKPIPEITNLKSSSINGKATQRKEKTAMIATTGDFAEVMEILSHLSEHRRGAYKEWLPVAFCCKNIGLPTALFLQWSQPADESRCITDYENITAKQTGYSIYTLYRFLKEDNPKMHKKVMATRVDMKKLMAEFDAGALARLYYEHHDSKYIYHTEGGWYWYNKFGLLKNSKDYPITMHNDIETFLKKIILKERNKLDINNDDYKKQIMENLKNHKLAGSHLHLKNIMAFLNNYYYQEDIMDKIDANSNLLAFNNMVYDLGIKDFRSITCTDYIMKSCGYDINLCSNPKIRQEIKELYLSIYDSEELCDYVMQTTAISFFNNDREEMFINTGRGGNGKGLIASIITEALGSYFYQLESTFLQTKFKANQGNGSLANCKGCRYVSLSEPECDGTAFNIAFIKSLSGGDKITTRHLFGHPITYLPQFTIFAQANEIPPLSEVNDAIVRRIRVIDHPFQFVSLVIDPETQKLGNCQLKKRVKQPEFVNEFMLYMLDIVKSMDTTKSIAPPAIVSDATNAYLDENNPVKLWFYERYQVSNLKSDRVLASELLNAYNETTDKPINAKYLKAKMDSFKIKQVKISNMYYVGIKKREVESMPKSECLI